MVRKKYSTPILFDLDNGGNVIVPGEGTGQGSIAPEGMSWEDWLEEIAWGYTGPTEDAPNDDADYNQDGMVDRKDYEDWLKNQLWNG